MSNPLNVPQVDSDQVVEAKLVASYPRRLEAVIAAKGTSTKYLVKRLNTYVNVIFQFFVFFFHK